MRAQAEFIRTAYARCGREVVRRSRHLRVQPRSASTTCPLGTRRPEEEHAVCCQFLLGPNSPGTPLVRRCFRTRGEFPDAGQNIGGRHPERGKTARMPCGGPHAAGLRGVHVLGHAGWNPGPCRQLAPHGRSRGTGSQGSEPGSTAGFEVSGQRLIPGPSVARPGGGQCSAAAGRMTNRRCGSGAPPRTFQCNTVDSVFAYSRMAL